jgi:adenylate cyclase
VVDAVECAIAIQQAMAERNADKPEEYRIVFRIGINVGDIIIDGEDIYGDGVNVAARLEALAEPGGICISRAVREQVQNKVPISFSDLGEKTVKNIEQPIHVYYVVLERKQSGAGPAANAAPSRGPREKRSIAVLPFANMSGDPEQEYFADGISEDLITALSKIPHLFVIARNSSFTFKGRAVHIVEVSKRLGSRFIVEGSVRKSGNRVRITAQLIDSVSGGHLWADRFDRDLTDIFAVQDEVTREIVAALALNLTESERRRVPAARTANPQAYDYFLRGREYWWRQSREMSAQAKEMVHRAIELDANFAAAHALLGAMHMADYINEWTDSPLNSLEQGREAAQKAVTLDDNDFYAHWALGLIHLWMRRHKEAITEQRRAILLNPNFPSAHAALGLSLYYGGEPAAALECYDRATAVDPFEPDVFLHFRAQAQFQLGRYEQAIELLKRRLIRNPDTDISRALLAATYGHLGRLDEARAEWAELLRVNPAYSIEHRRKALPYENPDDFELFANGLRKADLVN